jgi:hypothetical protein
MRRAFSILLFAVVLPILFAGYSAAAAPKVQKPDLTFSGVEALVFNSSCTAPYTTRNIGNSLCSVYAGTISGPVFGKLWQAAIIDLTVTRAAAGDTSPLGCHGMYLNIQFSGGVAVQTMHGFGSVCGPDNATTNYQSGQMLTGTGGWTQLDSNGNGVGVGTFVASFTPEKDANGDNLVITFQNASSVH